MQDLFEVYETLPQNIQDLITELGGEVEQGIEYSRLGEWLGIFEANGYTFKYGLDAQPFDLREMTDEEKGIFLLREYYQQSYEAKNNFKVKDLDKKYHYLVKELANFSKTGSIKGMKKMYYGQQALLVRCGQYIYNVTSLPAIYFLIAK